METIKIRTYGDVVYFLNQEGFQKGKIKRTFVISEKHKHLDISYRVVSDKDSAEFGGYEKTGSQLFDTKKEMIEHYSKN